MLKGFKMKLYPGMEAEYERRHKLLWQEMKDMIHEHGGKNYSIFLDHNTLMPFDYIEIEDDAHWAASADTAIERIIRPARSRDSHFFIVINSFL